MAWSLCGGVSVSQEGVGVKWSFPGVRWIFSRLLFVLIPLVCCVLVVAVYAYVHLSPLITAGFEGKHWSLPSKVYAEPVSLYPGAPLRIEDVRASLDRLGYRSVQSITAQGQYWINGQQIDISLRDFHYPYRVTPGRTVRVTVSGTTVQAIQDLHDKQAISTVDLEPQLVSEFFSPERAKRRLVRLAEIPPHLTQALIAIEDRRFYTHCGVDWMAALRALYRNLRAGK